MNIMIPNRHGHRLAVQIQGPEHATPVVFINALGTDHGMWQYQVAELEQDFRILTFDLRGHGQSELIASHDVQEQAEDVIDILDAFSIKKAHICGISMGGLIGLNLALIAAERVFSLTLANTAAQLSYPETWLNQANIAQRKGMPRVAAHMSRYWFSSDFDYKKDLVAQRCLSMLKHTAVQSFAHACQVLANTNFNNQLACIGVPSLMIAGASDTVAVLEDVRDLHAQIPGSQLCVLDASHLSNIEKPKAFFQVLRLFIRSI